jgi:hypothetical protein
MSLEDKIAKEKIAADPQINELRMALVSTQKQLARVKQQREEITRAVTRAVYEAMLAMGPIVPVEKPILKTTKAKDEVALLHATDWQGSKVTTTYDSEIMKKRVMEFAYKAAKITEIHRQDHAVKDCVIMFGGDMVEGLFNYPAQLWEVDSSLFEQYVTVSRLMVDFIRYILTKFEKVTVVAEWGNHGRIGSKRDHVPKGDNFDRMCYELARQLLEAEKRLTWEDCPEDIQKVEIGNYRALLMHGDEVGRAGFASPSAWQAAGNRWKAGSFKWYFQDIYLGHYHRFAQEPMSDQTGSIYWTGSTESDNRYARDSMAVSGVPSQRLHFIDPEKGRVTAQYQIWLD